MTKTIEELESELFVAKENADVMAKSEAEAEAVFKRLSKALARAMANGARVKAKADAEVERIQAEIYALEEQDNE
tara:strand:- start:10 stop:234 length:225 start_codon:yes stop_codon:yes gene_type:complete